MRRILRERKVDESTEKKQHKDLLSAINNDKQQQKAIEINIDHLNKNIAAYKAKEEEAGGTYLYWQGLCDKTEALFRELEVEVKPLESKVEELDRKITERKEKLEALEADFVKRRTEIEDEIKVKKSECVEISSDLDKEIKEKEIILETQKAKISILSKSEVAVARELADKERETEHIDASLDRRVKELARVNLNLSAIQDDEEEAKEALKKVDDKLEATKKAIKLKDIEAKEAALRVEEAEAKVLAQQEKVVSLLKREERLNELIPNIKDLYAKAGINVKI